MTNENGDDVDYSDDDDDLLQNFRYVKLDNDAWLHLSNDFFNQEQSRTRTLCGIVQQSSRIRESWRAPTLTIETLRGIHVDQKGITRSLASPICNKCEYTAGNMIRENSRSRIRRPRRIQKDSQGI
jgi:hypothetical protein